MLPPRLSSIRRPLSYLAVLSVPLAVLASPSGAPAVASAPVPQRHVIVQFTGAPALRAGAGLTAPGAAAHRLARAAVADAHAQRLSHAHTVETAIRDRGVDAHVTATFTYGFNGAAMTLPATDLATVRATPGVAHVYDDARVSASSLDPALSLIRAPQVWSRHDPAGQATDGVGETVAVVDTGIDYDDADLGGGFGPGHKVVGGYDFVNGDDDPMDDNGHGTHVAGIIAASPASADGITGVAPGARLTAYKVLDSNGSGNESTIIEGLEAAIDPSNPDRADVVNMSLGLHADSTDPLEQAAHTASESGVVVVTAAGNDGPGEGSSVSPGDAAGVLSVGATFSGVDLPSVSIQSPVHRSLATQLVIGSANPPASGEDLQLVDVGNGSPDSYDGLDVAGKAVLLTFPVQSDFDADLAAAAAHDVAAVVLSTPDYFATGTPAGEALAARSAATGNGDIGGYPFVSAEIDGNSATQLHELLAKGAVTLHVAGQDATDDLASFSSHGPAQDSYLGKPDLSAPGVEIRSTWLGDTQHLDSGTSMAAPHVAGAAALVLQDHPSWSAADVSSALASATHRLRYDATAAGSGRLDVASADDAKVLPTPWSFRLGLASMSDSRATAHSSVTLRNTGSRTAHVSLKLAAVASHHATVALGQRSVTIPAGGSREVELSARGPVTSTSYDVSGQVLGTVTSGSSTSTVRMPYLMAVRPMDLHPTPDPTTGPQTVEVYSQAPLTDPPTVSLHGPHGTTYSTTTTLVYDHWYQAALPAKGSAGTYHLTALSRSEDGRRLTGKVTFDRLGHLGSARWASVGPVGDAGILATTPADPRVGYMLPGRSLSGLVEHTTDGGETWAPVGQGVLDGGADLAIAADPTNAHTVYVVQTGGPGQPYTGRVLVSHDSGATWSALPMPDTSYRDIEVESDGRTLATLDFNGIIRYSHDRGATWTTIELPSDDPPQQLAFSGNDLYAAAGPDVWKLADLGSDTAPEVVWTQPGQYPNISELAARDGAVAVSGYDADQNGVRTLAVSTDGGSDWQSNAPSPTTVVTQLNWIGQDLFASSSGHSWELASGSDTWTSVTGLVSGGGPRQFAMLGGHQVASIEGLGIYRTTDGAAYQRIGVTGTSVRALAITSGADQRPRLVAGTEYGTYAAPVPEGKATEALRDWGRSGSETAYGENNVALAVDPTHRRTVYALRIGAITGFSVEKSTDGGSTWTAVETPRTSTIPYQIAVSRADPSDVYVTEVDDFGYGVLATTDGGKSWRRYAASGAVTAVAADPRHPRRLLLGGPDGLFRSTDGGQSEVRLSAMPVNAIAVDPRHPQHVVVAGTTISTSNDGGKTLHKATTGPGRMLVSSLTFVGKHGVCGASAAYGDDGGLLVGGRGVLCSNDAGHTWRNVSGDLPYRSITSVVVSPDGRWLYAGSLGQGVFRTGVRSLLH